jgi:hypothetical protein
MRNSEVFTCEIEWVRTAEISHNKIQWLHMWKHSERVTAETLTCENIVKENIVSSHMKHSEQNKVSVVYIKYNYTLVNIKLYKV